jgi:hypothetical protein
LLTLLAYGGYGFTTRNWGLTLDTMISAQIVLANGTIATASQDQNPDLFFVRLFRSAAHFHWLRRDLGSWLRARLFVGPPRLLASSHKPRYKRSPN